jgi:glycosyltransferase involved in cell wall biosynthesis
MCDAFHAHGIGRPEQFTVIPSGVDLAAFAPAPDARQRVRNELGIPGGAPVIGIVARLDKLKGHDDLLDVLPSLAEIFPDVRVLFVGDGYQRALLERRVINEKLGGLVTFTGLVAPSRVAELLTAMDVCALPSYQEGQSRVLVQALLGGCGIVGYDAGGIGEVCIDGQTGRLVPVGNREALRDAIVWMLEHPAERAELVERGRRYVTERFDARVMVKRLEEVYREVLEK